MEPLDRQLHLSATASATITVVLICWISVVIIYLSSSSIILQLLMAENSETLVH